MDDDKFLIEINGKEFRIVNGFKEGVSLFLKQIQLFIHKHDQVINEYGLFSVGATYGGRLTEFKATDEEIVFNERLSYIMTNFYWDIGDQTKKNMKWIKKSYSVAPFKYYGQSFSYSLVRSKNEIKVDLHYDDDSYFSSNAFAFIDPSKEYYFILSDRVLISSMGSDELPLGKEVNFSIKLRKIN